MTTHTLPSPSTLSVDRVREQSQLDGLAEAWNELSGDMPFRSFEWAQSWWRHYRCDNCELFTLAVRDEQGEIVGLAPWYLESSRRAGRVVRFLGSGEVCSDYLTLLCRPDCEQAVASRLGDWMACEAADEWHLIELDGIDRANTAVCSLADRLCQRGHTVDTQTDLNCWRVELPDEWDRYLSTLSKSRRSRTRSVLRDLVDSGSVKLHRVETPEELERGFEILIDLHQRRRRSLSQAGCFSSPRFTAFHREVSARLLAAGQLRLVWTELDSRPFTVDYSVTSGDTVFYYQGGFDPDKADSGPGWVSHATSLRLAIEEGYRGYDFLRGDEAYKASWGAVPRPLVRLRIVGKQVSARARYATWRGLQAVKRRTRRLLVRTEDPS